jgi:Rrf2 family protein
VKSEFTIAVHSLVYLAYLPDHMASSDAIAKNVCTNAARIRKIMSCLRKAGLVTTKEGLGGGYILNASPEDVSLSQVYRATCLGSLKPNWCTGDPEVDCLISANIQTVLDEILEDTEAHLLKYLNEVTLQSVLEKTKR